MSAWIQSHQSLRDHPKTRRLARRDGVGGIRGAVGLLHCLWWWCIDYAPDGDLSRYDAEDIAIACEWEGDPDTLVSMLVETGFLSDDGGSLQVHDWNDYGGKLLERRERNAEQMRRARARRKNDGSEQTHEHVYNTLKTREDTCRPREEKSREEKTRELNPLASASALTDEQEIVSASDSDTTNDFAEWWAAYGKVGSKADALTLYRYWRQHGATADDLLMAAVAYRQHCEATACKLQHARTFLARKPCRWREWADGEEHGSMDVVGDARLQDVIAAGMEWMEGSDGGLAPGAVVAIEAGRGDTHTAGGEDARRSLPAGSVAGAERRGLHDGSA